ncbi:MAG: AAA family ATPase [Saprospiraceae bacterium]|nr:AAA family ATPase [Saprospiraceae bacterium]
MLRSIQLQNFMSFGSTAKPIMLNSDSNLLVGINGSGKSNFLKAIQLLTEGVREKEDFSVC